MLPLILLEKISKHYRLQTNIYPILNAINLSVNEGEWLTLIGASGSGKSTLMHILGFLDQADSGIYRFQGRLPCWNNSDQLAYLRNRAIGFVFQAFHLLPRLTVVENVALPLWYQGIERRAALRLAHAGLQPLSMEALAQHKPQQLSGGQQQRVAIARALVTAPALLLADEPTGALDRQTATDILQVFSQLHRQGKTIVMVSHDPWVALHGSRIIQLAQGSIGSDQRTLT